MMGMALMLVMFVFMRIYGSWSQIGQDIDGEAAG